MKKTLALVALGVLTSVAAFGQGSINFANLASGLNQPIRDTDGSTLIPSTGYKVELFYGPTGSTAAQLIDSGISSGFVSAGYFNNGGVSVSVPFPTFDSANPGPVAFQLRVWQVSAGATWAAATGGAFDQSTPSTYVANGGTKWGFSSIFVKTPAVAPATAAVLTTLTSFNLVPVPEPTTIALGGLGAAALLLFRRRK